MADMLSYRIGMLKHLNETIHGRCIDAGRTYHQATLIEIRGLAELSMTVCPSRHDFATWKNGYSGMAFPTREQIQREFSREYAARMLEQLKERLSGTGVSTQKHATAAYQQNNRPRAESKGV